MSALPLAKPQRQPTSSRRGVAALHQPVGADPKQADGARGGVGPAEEQERGVEMVWTLVPAALIAALALMLSGFTDGAWIQSRTGDTPLVGPRAIRIDGP